MGTVMKSLLTVLLLSVISLTIAKPNEYESGGVGGAGGGGAYAQENKSSSDSQKLEIRRNCGLQPTGGSSQFSRRESQGIRRRANSSVEKGGKFSNAQELQEVETSGCSCCSYSGLFSCAEIIITEP